MSHAFEGHPDVTDTCVHRFTDPLGYEYICGAREVDHDSVPRHLFVASHTGMVCDQMVMRDGGGEPCGLPREDPLHTVKVTPIVVGGYADGTTGHSGTETSEARVRRDDTYGTTAERQARVLSYLGAYNLAGMTVKELRKYEREWHHGVASAALTNLHKAGKIARLAEVRDGCKVYVMPEWVGDRETEAYASRSPKPEPLTEVERLMVTNMLATRAAWPDEGAPIAASALAKIKAGAQ